MNNIPDIEQLFRKGFENFEGDVNADAWTNIQSQLRPSASTVVPKTNPTGIAAGKLAAVIATVVVTAGAVIYIAFPGDQPAMPQKVVLIDQKKEAQVAEVPVIVPQASWELQSSPVNNNVNKTTVIPIVKEKHTVIPAVVTDISKPQEQSASVPGTADPAKNLSTDRSSAGTTPSPGNNEADHNNSVAGDNSKSPEKQPEIPVAPDESGAPPGIIYSETASVSQIPNVFTPNGDGLNDIFSINNFCRNIKSLRVEIRDRTGNLVYSWDGIDGSWDGKLVNGTQAPAGNYICVIFGEGSDGKPIKPLMNTLTVQ